MKTLTKIMIAASMMLMLSTANALRCGNELIDVGDPVYKVEVNCTIAYKYRVVNTQADIVKYYVKMSGTTYTIIVVDGVVTGVTESRL